MYKDIHIGHLILSRLKEMQIPEERVCQFLRVSAEDIELTFLKKSLDTDTLLRWSKLLEYDFFRIYSQHLILYSPLPKELNSSSKPQKINSLQLKKKLYTKELIDFILEQINTGRKTKREVMDDYRIPKTTLYKWIEKYGKNNEKITL